MDKAYIEETNSFKRRLTTKSSELAVPRISRESEEKAEMRWDSKRMCVKGKKKNKILNIVDYYHSETISKRTSGSKRTLF